MRTTLAAGLLCLAALPLEADFDAGKAAHERRDYATALKEWQASADRGDARAEHGLGTLYLAGQGVRADPRAAVDWFRRAAGRGHAEAQFALAQALQQGNGVRKDLLAAAEWFLKAGMQKHSSAQYALARMYELGQGVEADDVKALAFYKLAVDAGHPFAVEWGLRLELEVSPETITKADRYAKDIMAKGKDAKL